MVEKELSAYEEIQELDIELEVKNRILHKLETEMQKRDMQTLENAEKIVANLQNLVTAYKVVILDLMKGN